MKAKTRTCSVGELDIPEIKTQKVDIWIKGEPPSSLIMEAMSEKVIQQLLMPKIKTRADRANNLKHNPKEEFVGMCYRYMDNRQPTRLYMPANCIKRAIVETAPRIPGVAKTELNQMVWILGDTMAIYGVPQMKFDVVRLADMNRTPDIRFRPCFSEWCAKVSIEVMIPALSAEKVGRLLAYAGHLMGLGGWRRQKGGNFGVFNISTAAECKSIVRAGGRAQQDKAIENPGFYDEPTRRLYQWFLTEVSKRGDDHKLSLEDAAAAGLVSAEAIEKAPDVDAAGA